ncbi:universal stress protein [Aestuariibaculum suncheonense]|uniref:Universal stress protein n=1 Tax=Aestuariibaculum suncheonense TaxID=1028745 RepID=A0A8J6QLI2_9FLAO|nr:universal stress protein [Aestuariibaculum suncheonense]MBD0836646.1 universal stress protein [Aestuariibaculum suncheonense]
MKKILVPTDFSTEAENALKVAAQLAKKHNCELHLLHILEIPLHQVDPISGFSELPEALFFMKLAHKQFTELREKNYLKDIKIQEHVEFHEIFKGVFHVCKKQHIDLVIMGSSGANGLKEIFIGSNTEKVVRTSETPVLVIKNEHNNFSVDNMVYASDFETDSQSAFESAVSFAKLFQSKLHLIMVNTPNYFITTEEANAKIEHFTKDFNLKDYTTIIYNDASVESGILNYAKSISADLIGISTHGRKGLSHFFNGSISEDLVNHANRPIITFKTKE